MRRWLSILLAVALCLGCLGAAAVAENDDAAREAEMEAAVAAAPGVAGKLLESFPEGKAYELGNYQASSELEIPMGEEVAGVNMYVGGEIAVGTDESAYVNLDYYVSNDDNTVFDNSFLMAIQPEGSGMISYLATDYASKAVRVQGVSEGVPLPDLSLIRDLLGKVASEEIEGHAFEENAQLSICMDGETLKDLIERFWILAFGGGEAPSDFDWDAMASEVRLNIYYDEPESLFSMYLSGDALMRRLLSDAGIETTKDPRFSFYTEVKTLDGATADIGAAEYVPHPSESTEWTDADALPDVPCTLPDAIAALASCDTLVSHVPSALAGETDSAVIAQGIVDLLAQEPGYHVDRFSAGASFAISTADGEIPIYYSNNGSAAAGADGSVYLDINNSIYKEDTFEDLVTDNRLEAVSLESGGANSWSVTGYGYDGVRAPGAAGNIPKMDISLRDDLFKRVASGELETNPIDGGFVVEALSGDALANFMKSYGFFMLGSNGFPADFDWSAVSMQVVVEIRNDGSLFHVNFDTTTLLPELLKRAGLTASGECDLYGNVEMLPLGDATADPAVLAVSSYNQPESMTEWVDADALPDVVSMADSIGTLAGLAGSGAISNMKGAAAVDEAARLRQKLDELGAYEAFTNSSIRGELLSGDAQTPISLWITNSAEAGEDGAAEGYLDIYENSDEENRYGHNIWWVFPANSDGAAYCRDSFGEGGWKYYLLRSAQEYFLPDIAAVQDILDRISSGELEAAYDYDLQFTLSGEPLMTLLKGLFGKMIVGEDALSESADWSALSASFRVSESDGRFQFDLAENNLCEALLRVAGLEPAGDGVELSMDVSFSATEPPSIDEISDSERYAPADAPNRPIGLASLLLNCTGAAEARAQQQADEAAFQPEQTTDDITLSLNGVSVTLRFPDDALYEGSSFDHSSLTKATIADAAGGVTTFELVESSAKEVAYLDSYEVVTYNGMEVHQHRSMKVTPGKYHLEGMPAGMPDQNLSGMSRSTIEILLLPALFEQLNALSKDLGVTIDTSQIVLVEDEPDQYEGSIFGAVPIGDVVLTVTFDGKTAEPEAVLEILFNCATIN